MAQRLSIFHPPGRIGLVGNPFGKDVANLELYRSLAVHGGFEQVDWLSVRHATDAQLVEDVYEGQACPTRLVAGSILNPTPPVQSGLLLRGQPDLYNLGWLRRRTARDTDYSLVGLAHTLAPPAMRQVIANAMVAPIHPWDAIICTSPSVRDGLERMFADWGDHLAERTGGAAPARPALPIIPLGVDAARFAGLADRPEARARLRAALGLADADILVSWVGRLSYFEKAFPQPMFQAVQAATRATGAKVCFALSGWFPNDADRGRYEEAAAHHAPDVAVRFLDGNDRAQLGDLWAASDIFLSLVDNIQETFGITPLEAMAAGLPVVASDWDGYRSTVRHGLEGFLIPTLGGPPGPLGEGMSLRHVMELDSYQMYVGRVAQHTAVNIGRCAEALAELIRSPDLRRRMGAAGRERIRTTFDWPVVVGQIGSLLDELTAIRTAAAPITSRHRMDPVRGDPFVDFAGFATHQMSPDLPLSAVPGRTPAQVTAISGGLDQAFDGWRGSLQECAQALDLLASGKAASVRDVLEAFPVNRRRSIELGLVWLAKHGFVDWPT